MRPKKAIEIRSFGQRTLHSTLNIRPRSTTTSNAAEKNNPGSNLSLTHFLNRNLHSSTSVLPSLNKDKDTLSMIKKDNICPPAELNTLEKSIVEEKKFDSKEPRDERGCVIDDSVFKLFNDSGEKVRKRSSECITATSECESVFKKQSPNHLLVLGDDPKPKRRTQREASYSYDKPRPVYNHYKNGTGWWEPEREGVDSDEVGNSEMWEGVGSTTLGGLSWH